MNIRFWIDKYSSASHLYIPHTDLIIEEIELKSLYQLSIEESYAERMLDFICFVTRRMHIMLTYYLIAGIIDQNTEKYASKDWWNSIKEKMAENLIIDFGWRETRCALASNFIIGKIESSTRKNASRSIVDWHNVTEKTMSEPPMIALIRFGWRRIYEMPAYNPFIDAIKKCTEKQSNSTCKACWDSVEETAKTLILPKCKEIKHDLEQQCWGKFTKNKAA